MIVRQWKHKGLECFVRLGIYDCPCGYVALPRDSRILKSMSWKSSDTEHSIDDMFYAPGGITFNGPLFDDPQNRHCIGFDTAHAGDITPDLKPKWSIDKVCAATNVLADQIYDYEMKEDD